MKVQRPMTLTVKKRLAWDLTDELTDIDRPKPLSIAYILKCVPKEVLTDRLAKHFVRPCEYSEKCLADMLVHVPLEKLLAYAASERLTPKYGRYLTKRQLNYVIENGDSCFGKLLCNGDERQHCRERNYCASRYSERLGCVYVWEHRPVEGSARLSRNPKRQRGTNQHQHGEIAMNRETGPDGNETFCDNSIFEDADAMIPVVKKPHEGT